MTLVRGARLAASLLLACACGGAATPGSCKAGGPTAISGPAQQAAKHHGVQLAGSALGTQGDVAYAWRLDAVPAGSAAILSAANVANPTFTADRSGTYLASLIVQDACGTSAAATTVVTVANHAPIAFAGPDQHVNPGDTVTLDGSGSVDPDGDPLDYRWQLVLRPPGSKAALSSTTAPKPQLVPDAYGDYLVLLIVGDGEASASPVEVLVEAGVTGPGGSCFPAAAPAANPGHDQTLSAGAVFLDGSASTTGRATPLVYSWSISRQPPGSSATLDTPGAARTNLYPDRPGIYLVSLVVNDGCVNSAPATVTITRTNNVPNAQFYLPNGTVPLLVPFTLQGFGSDLDNEPLSYQWRLLAAPAGSSAALSDPALQQPTLTPDLPGTYSLSFVVSDAVSSSPPALGSFTAVNVPPVAAVGPDLAANLGATVTLDGSASADPSHRPLAFAWTLQLPAGSKTALSAANAARPSFVADVTGVYSATLVVTAGGLGSPAVINTITVWPPVGTLGHRVLDAAYSSSLERVISVGVDPSALYLTDPRGAAEIAVALSAAPSSVSLSPDGKFAAVGHTNAISYVDLAKASVAQVLTVTADVARVSVGDNGFLYALTRAGPNDHPRMVAVPLGAGQQSSLTSGLFGSPAALVRPGAGALYLTTASTNNFSTVEEYSLGGSLPVLSTPSSAANAGSCGDLWLSHAGTRLFTRCGTVLHASSSYLDDLSAAGSLAHALNVGFAIHHLDDSTAAGEVSAVASQDSPYSYNPPDDRTLRSWDSNGLTARQTLLLPANASGFQWSGRFVFYRSDGSERYLVLQLDPLAGALQDFGLVTF